jgi:hypothetical protein
MSAPYSFPESGIWNVREVYRRKSGGQYPGGDYAIELLLVGGGGGGGGWWGPAGGGGGAGVIYSNSLTIRAGCCYPIVIGAGSSGGGQGFSVRGSNSTFCYTTGSPTGVSFLAWGGGGGGSGDGPVQSGAPTEMCGGSGGGGGSMSPSASPNAPCFLGGCAFQNNPIYWGAIGNITGYGTPGGNYCVAQPGAPSPTARSNGAGGGGGATATGQPGHWPGNPIVGSQGGPGGAGICFTISGATVGYAGGGGGEPIGQGLPAFGSGWPVFCVPAGCINDALANRGSGGGGHQGNNQGKGGSGIAIIKYSGSVRALGGNGVVTCLTPTTSTIHCFTGSGCFIA